MTVACANIIDYNRFHSSFPFLFPLKSVFSASYPLIFMFSFVGFPLSLVRISPLSVKGKLFPVKIKKGSLSVIMSLTKIVSLPNNC